MNFMSLTLYMRWLHWHWRANLRTFVQQLQLKTKSPVLWAIIHGLEKQFLNATRNVHSMSGSSIHEFCKNQMRLLMEVYFQNSPKVKQPSLAAIDGNIAGITGLEVNSSWILKLTSLFHESNVLGQNLPQLWMVNTAPHLPKSKAP